MKKIYRGLLLLIGFLAAVSAKAEVYDLGEMSLDQDYELTTFKGYKGVFIAPKSGVVTCSSTTTDELAPYSNADCDANSKVDVTHNGLYGPHTYDFNVEEGKTYYMYTSFVMNSGTTFRMTMADEQVLTLKESSPELNGTYNVSNGGGQVSFSFNKAVAFTDATLTFGSVTEKIGTQVYNNSIFTNDVQAKVWNWLINDMAHEGDSITVTVNGICMASDNSVKYNGDGTLVARFVLGRMPIYLVSTEHTSGNFLSYYTEDNEEGTVRLTFSGPVGVMDDTKAMIKYGNIDKDFDGEYYVEYLPVTVDGNTVTVNLQGKRRKATDMVVSGDDYGVVDLGFLGIIDTYGNFAYSPAQGSMGSYWYEYAYKQIDADILVDFTPTSGSELGTRKSLEVWINDGGMLHFDGVEFAFEKEGQQDSLLVTDYETEADTDPDYPTAIILTVTLPDELTGARNIVMTLHNLTADDGDDYSGIVRAEYNLSNLDGVGELNVEGLKLNVDTYNIAGQRINGVEQGICIKNRKKYINK